MLTPSTRTLGMARTSVGPREIRLDDVERLLAGRKLRRHPIADVLADERAGQRRHDRDAALRGLRFVRAHDLVADLLAALVLEQHGRGEGDAVARGGRVDDLGGPDLALELGDAALDERLLLARGVVFRVLGEVAVRPGFGDRLGDGVPVDTLEAIELVAQTLVPRTRHRRALDRHGALTYHKRRPVLLLVIDPRALQRAPALLAGLGLLSLAFDRGLFVIHAALHLLVEPALDHHLLESLQRGFDLIVRDLDLRSGQTRHGRAQPRREAGKWVSTFELARAPLIQDSHARLCFCTRTSFWILSRSAASPPMSAGTRSSTFTT